MADEDEAAIPAGNATIQDRIAAFGMLDQMADATQAAKIYRLSLVGFKRGEIAMMMQTTPAAVSQAIYEQKNKSKKKPAKA
ncbi:MAG: hypothetical protein QM598_01885 [Protaetiibacter sp.]